LLLRPAKLVGGPPMAPSQRRNRGSQICAAAWRAFIAVEGARGLDESSDFLIRYALVSYESGFQVHPSVSR
jgi:hypothetical protein